MIIRRRKKTIMFFLRIDGSLIEQTWIPFTQVKYSGEYYTHFFPRIIFVRKGCV